MKYKMAGAAVVLSLGLLTACGSGDVSGLVQSKQIDGCETLSVEPMSSLVKGTGGGKAGGKASVTKPDKTNTNKPGGSSSPTGSKDSKPPKDSKSKDKKKSCSTEYELVVNDKEDGLVEQDVTSEEYARCEVGEKYPACKED